MVTRKLRYSAESKYSVITYVDGINVSSGKLPTHPSPKLTLTLTSHLGQNVSLGEGLVDSFSETLFGPVDELIIISIVPFAWKMTEINTR